MVDIIDFRLRVDQFDQVTDNGDDILVGEHARFHRDVQIQFFVDTVASHFAEVIAFLGEEELVKSGARRFLIGGLSALELHVDILDGLFARVGRIFLQCVENHRIVNLFLILFVEENRFDIRFRHHVDVVFLEYRLAVDDHFRTGDIHHLTGLVIYKILVPCLGDGGRQFLAHILLQVGFGCLHLLGDVENAEDVLVRLIADGAQQRRDRQFLLTVDVRIKDIVDVGGEFHPGAFEGDDTG